MPSEDIVVNTAQVDQSIQTLKAKVSDLKVTLAKTKSTRTLADLDFYFGTFETSLATSITDLQTVCDSLSQFVKKMTAQDTKMSEQVPAVKCTPTTTESGPSKPGLVAFNPDWATPQPGLVAWPGPQPDEPGLIAWPGPRRGKLVRDPGFVASEPGLVAWMPGLAAGPGVAPVVDPEVELMAGLTELQLRQEGLLTGPTNAHFSEWLTNAAGNGVDPDVVIEMVDTAKLAPADFGVLDAQTRIVDGGGRSYFMLAPDATAEEVRRAVVMTYVYNADTGAGDVGVVGDGAVEQAGYSAGEVRRILGRQQANSWSYDGGGPSTLVDVGAVLASGGRVAATPNGMLVAVMGAGGGAAVAGGAATAGPTASGDLFVLPHGGADPAGALTAAIQSDGVVGGEVGLGASLQQAELESRQWANDGWMRYVDLHGGSGPDSAGRDLVATDWIHQRMLGEGPQAWEQARAESPT